MKKIDMTSAIATVETAYEELLQTAKVVLNDYHRISESENHYRGKYCYPFFTQGSYYVERDNYRTNEHCFMPMPLDDDMRKFVEALRKLEELDRWMSGGFVNDHKFELDFADQSLKDRYLKD